jgi:hypothetical protein
MVAMSAPRRYRLALTIVLGIALLAAFYVGIVRERKEHGSRRVEIALDYQDFSALAQSYGYDEAQFLVALRRAGLTSLAISEELGGSVNSGTAALLYPGQQLIAQAKLQPFTDPTLAALARRNALSPNELYLIVFDPREVGRYRAALAEHLGSHAVRTLHASGPTILAIRSQIDYFDGLGLGLPQQQLALARKLGLFVVPRVQNDERFGAPQIASIFKTFARYRPSTIVFFGPRNEVLGFLR